MHQSAAVLDPQASDLILINDLSIHMALGDSHWPHPQTATRPQPVLVSLTIPLSLDTAASGDSLPDTVNYGTLCKTVEGLAKQRDASRTYSGVGSFAEAICSTCLDRFPSTTQVKVRVEKARALLHGKGAGIELVRRRGDAALAQVHWFIRDLDISTIIGVHPWERQEKQIVRINLQWTCSSTTAVSEAFDFRKLARVVSESVDASSYQTIESLATEIARVGLSTSQGLMRLTVRVAKPSALMFAGAGAVEITRGVEILQSTNVLPSDSDAGWTYALALGSNIGDRFGNIERALRALEEQHGVKVVDTSFLYETAPMYVTDQPKFVNGACLVSTALLPQELLKVLKDVEVAIGRTPNLRNGPRVVDLDILFLRNEVLHNEEPMELIIPHKSIQEREFVLRPLADILPDFVHPILKRTVTSLLSSIVVDNTMYRVIAFPPKPYDAPAPDHAHSASPRYLALTHRTYLMATLNTTPDSFSDGGSHNALPAALAFARTAQDAGADMIDIGGYSTRPGAQHVDPKQEAERVVPYVEAIRQTPGMEDIPISVDTFRGSVAEAAIRAGANCINDVYALHADDDILSVAVKTGVPVVMMHSRGDSGQDKEYKPTLAKQSYNEAVLDAIRTELGGKVQRALKAGIRRWNIIVDPGIGFSKTTEGNVGLLRNLSQLTVTDPAARAVSAHVRSPLASFPVLIGTSRKSFLGQVINRPQASPMDRVHATGATLAVAVQQGVDIVRVHDVKEMKDVLQMVDAVWRK